MLALCSRVRGGGRNLRVPPRFVPCRAVPCRHGGGGAKRPCATERLLHIVLYMMPYHADHHYGPHDGPL